MTTKNPTPPHHNNPTTQLHTTANAILTAEEATLLPAHLAAITMNPDTTRTRTQATAKCAAHHQALLTAGHIGHLVANDAAGWLDPTDSALLHALLRLVNGDPGRHDPELTALEDTYRATYAAGTLDTSQDLVARIAHRRAQLAGQAGYDSWADMVLHTEMAGSATAVANLVATVAPAVRDAVRRPRPDTAPPAPGPVNVDTALRSVAETAHRLWGVTATPDQHHPRPHPDAGVWRVDDADGQPLGHLVLDLHARAGKRSGAWTKPLSLSDRAVSVQMNLTDGAASAAQVRTLHHEVLGHAAHYLLADTAHPLLAGTYSLPHDAREIHGVVAEHWTPGDGGPVDPVDYHAFLQAVVIDQAWHTLDPDRPPITDVDRFETAALTRAGLRHPDIAPRYRSRQHRHIWTGGYSGRYYAYLWADTLAADITATRPSIDRDTGHRWRTVLAAGASRDQNHLLREFLGREPIPDTFLASLTGTAATRSTKRRPPETNG